MSPFLQFILALAVILTAAKVGGYLTNRLGQPAVMGEVLAGLLLGTSALNFFEWPVFTDIYLSDMISHLAGLGVLLLLFIAGLDLPPHRPGKIGQERRPCALYRVCIDSWPWLHVGFRLIF